eukprot:3640809-Rhodomonas_salina.2
MQALWALRPGSTRAPIRQQRQWRWDKASPPPWLSGKGATRWRAGRCAWRCLRRASRPLCQARRLAGPRHDVKHRDERERHRGVPALGGSGADRALPPASRPQDRGQPHPRCPKPSARSCEHQLPHSRRKPAARGLHNNCDRRSDHHLRGGQGHSPYVDVAKLAAAPGMEGASQSEAGRWAVQVMVKCEEEDGGDQAAPSRNTRIARRSDGSDASVFIIVAGAAGALARDRGRRERVDSDVAEAAEHHGATVIAIESMAVRSKIVKMVEAQDGVADKIEADVIHRDEFTGQ